MIHTGIIQISCNTKKKSLIIPWHSVTFWGLGNFAWLKVLSFYLQTHVFNYLWCLSNGKIKNVTRPLIIIFFEVTYSMNSTCKIAIQQLHILQSVVEITNWFRFSQDMQYTWTLDFVVSIEYYLINRDNENILDL